MTEVQLASFPGLCRGTWYSLLVYEARVARSSPKLEYTSVSANGESPAEAAIYIGNSV